MKYINLPIIIKNIETYFYSENPEYLITQINYCSHPYDNLPTTTEVTSVMTSESDPDANSKSGSLVVWLTSGSFRVTTFVLSSSELTDVPGSCQVRTKIEQK